MIFSYKKSFASLGLLSLLTGCGTMNFVNGVNIDDTVKREQWHHSGLFDLIEFSSPLKIKYLCDNKQWNRITVEKSFANIMASSIHVYTPWVAYYDCRDNIDY